MSDQRDHMPHGERERELLRRRAQRLACEQDRRQVEIGELFLETRIDGGGHFGVPYRVLMEVLRPRELTPVPSTPAFVAGVIPRRGDLIAAIDLGMLLAGRACAMGDEARLVVVRSQNMTVGLLVDEVVGNVRYTSESLTPPIQGRFVSGIHAGNTALLDMEEMLSHVRLQLETPR